MKKNYFTTSFTIIAITALILISPNHQNAMADIVQKETLENYFENEVNSLDQAIQSSPLEAAIISNNDEADGYFFRRFWLRIRPRAEFVVPGLAGLSVIPEVELLWEKPVPQNWEIYKTSKKK